MSVFLGLFRLNMNLQNNRKADSSHEGNINQGKRESGKFGGKAARLAVDTKRRVPHVESQTVCTDISDKC